MSLTGILGALLGAALGYWNASWISRVVIAALERTDHSQTETERADYRGKIRRFWLILHIVFTGGGMAAGAAILGWLL